MVDAAEKARRSLNGQIVRVLERWLDDPVEPIGRIEEREGE